MAMAAVTVQATPMALTASLLAPSTAMLQWVAEPTTAPLKLTAPFLSAPLSLPSPSSSVSASGHLLVTDLRIDSPLDFTVSSASAASSPTVLGLDSPASVHAMVTLHPPPLESVDLFVWDLSGARLESEVACADSLCETRRIRWSAAHTADDPAAPALRYSVFVEWTASTISAAEEDAGEADSEQTCRQPTLSKQMVRICTAQGTPKRQMDPLYCDIPTDRLPRGVELTLTLLTECDYHVAAAASIDLPHCWSAVAPTIAITLDPLPSPVGMSSAALPHIPETATSVLFDDAASRSALPGVPAIVNDTAVRIALCNFYELTSQGTTSDCQRTPPVRGWCHDFGWKGCDRNVSVCHWDGLTCDDGLQTITAIELISNGLTSPVPLDAADLLAVLPNLRKLELAKNSLFVLSSLNLTQLTSLQMLVLADLPAPGLVIPLTLPSPCALTELVLTDSLFQPSPMESCTNMTGLVLDNLSPAVSIPFASIVTMSRLELFQAPQVTITSEPVGSYGGGLAGGSLVQFILSNLYLTNPALIELDLSGSTIDFGSGPDNMPHIRSPVMSLLRLEELPQLRTGPMGPADLHWLADMPALTEFSAIGLSGVVVHTNAFAFASRMLFKLELDGTSIVGDLTPLFTLRNLGVLSLSSSGLRSPLPANISQIWPYLATLDLSGCAMYGPLPSFQNMALLTTLQLQMNSFSSSIGRDFLEGSTAISSLSLSGKSVENRGEMSVLACKLVRLTDSVRSFACPIAILSALTSPLPDFCTNPLISLALFDNNRLISLPNFTCWKSVAELDLVSVV